MLDGECKVLKWSVTNSDGCLEWTLVEKKDGTDLQGILQDEYLTEVYIFKEGWVRHLVWHGSTICVKTGSNVSSLFVFIDAQTPSEVVDAVLSLYYKAAKEDGHDNVTFVKPLDPECDG